jgi:hypothetical protein
MTMPDQVDQPLAEVDAAASDGTSEVTGSGPLDTMKETAREAAGTVRAVAGTAAERLPSAVAQAQSTVDDTARVLNQWPDQRLVVGTSFSIGLGVGMFLSGTNRLLVAVALIPAAAMAATLMGRDTRSPDF